MKMRSFTKPAVLLWVVVLLIGACGGGDLEGYMTAVQDVNARFSDDVAGLPQLDADSSLDEVEEFFDRAGTALDRALASLEELNPPEVAAEDHEAYVTSMMEYAELNEQIVAAVSQLESAESFGELTADPLLGANAYNLMGVRAVATCREIQEIADQDGLGVDLGCTSVAGG